MTETSSISFDAFNSFASPLSIHSGKDDPSNGAAEDTNALADGGRRPSTANDDVTFWISSEEHTNTCTNFLDSIAQTFSFFDTPNVLQEVRTVRAHGGVAFLSHTTTC